MKRSHNSLDDGLSDDLIRLLLEYLCYEEKINLIMINRTFISTFLKSTRIITKSLSTITQESITREKILSFIEDPYQQFNLYIEHVLEEEEEEEVVQEEEQLQVEQEQTGTAAPVAPAALAASADNYDFDDHNENFNDGNEKVELTNDKDGLFCPCESANNVEMSVTMFQRNFQHSFHQIQHLNLSFYKDEDETEILRLMHFLAEKNLPKNSSSSSTSQLSTVFLKHLTLTLPEEFYFMDMEVQYLPYIPNLVSASFDLYRLYIIPPQYGNLYKLSLTDCHLLEDVSAFGNIHDLSLDRCPGVKDIRGLQNNHKIRIEDCEGITDYSQSFENSVIIEITPHPRCKPPQFSRLKKVHVLRTMDFPLEAGPLLFPATLQRYKICCSLIDPLQWNGLEMLRYLGLVKIPFLTSVRLFGSIPSLELRYLDDLTSLEGLGKGNRRVFIGGCHKITDFSPLKCIPRLEIKNCEGFHNAEDVNHVKDLSLHFLNTIDLSPLGKGNDVFHLYLDYLFHPSPSVTGLRNILVIVVRLGTQNPEPYLTELLTGNHQKIICSLRRTRQSFDIQLFPMNDSYHRYICEQDQSVTYLRK